jgi:hypothetical protein
VWRLAAAIFDIAIHRRGPDELPASRFLLGLLLGLYLIVGVISLWAFGLNTEANVAALVIDCAFFIACVFVTLRLFGHERRFIQTTSALLGTDVVLSLIGLPLSFWTRDPGAPVDQISVVLILRILILLWWIDVAGFIFGRALGRPYVIGLVFVILYVAVSLNIRDLVAPAT